MDACRSGHVGELREGQRIGPADESLDHAIQLLPNLNLPGQIEQTRQHNRRAELTGRRGEQVAIAVPVNSRGAQIDSAQPHRRPEIAPQPLGLLVMSARLEL